MSRPPRPSIGTEEFLKIFLEKILPDQKTNCWNWLGSRDGHGYGRIGVQSKRWSAHRLAWTMHNGPVPPGLHVLHKCDNPSCVNPNHLWLGSHADNMIDRERKGRNAATRLTQDQKNRIRQRYKPRTVTIANLAHAYRVSRMAIVRAIHDVDY